MQNITGTSVCVVVVRVLAKTDPAKKLLIFSRLEESLDKDSAAMPG